jgi:branched-chain amino acid transport system permease protein
MSSLASAQTSVASAILTSRRFWLVMVAIAIGLLPMILTDSYWQTNLIVCAINVLLAIGLDFVLGYAGQLNLGQSAFYGIGAYASTLLITRLGVPFWVAFMCGVLLAGLAGMLLSIFAVRLRGHYLAIASLGFAVITYQVLLNWISLTQGPLGIYAIAPPPPLTIPSMPAIEFTDLGNLFYLTAGFALLTYILLDQLVRSPVGETLTAIREDEVSATSLGINCPKWKVFAFAISSAVAGAAGCFYASFVGTLVPDAFFITESFTILAMVIVGGMGTLIGPGISVTLVVLFMPGGMVQAARLVAGRVRRRLATTPARPKT